MTASERTAIVHGIMTRFPGKYVLIRAGGGQNILLFALPYTPRREARPGFGFVDSYYEAYQQIYHWKTDIRACLADSGIETADAFAFRYPLLAASSGMGMLLRNGLALIPEYGSFFTMEAILLPETEGVPSGEVKKAPLCRDCTLCRNACPAACITEFPDGARCLRERQKEGYVPDETCFQKMGNRVLGCNLCQRVCPYNRTFSAAESPDRFRLSVLFRAAAEGRKGLEAYMDVFGRNYLRPKWILALVISAMSHEPCDEYDGLIRSLAGECDPRVKSACERYRKIASRKDCSAGDLEG